MIEIVSVQVLGWEAAIRGMRNPMNSWDKSDSFQCFEDQHCEECHNYNGGSCFTIGENDLELMKKLSWSGPDHGKFMRMITVTCDIIAPLYWWKEFDTYKVGTVANSCSTMHKIHSKEFTMDDFSFEHIIDEYLDYYSPNTLTQKIVKCLNECREKFLETKDKTYWWQMIQLLPSSYNQKRTVQLNYAVLKNIYHARKNHKLDEWHEFCRMIENLPHAEELIVGEE